MRTSKQKLLISLFLIGWIFSSINMVSRSGGMINPTIDDPNTAYLTLPTNATSFTFGAKIGEFVLLELTELYQTSFGGLQELGDTMNYRLMFQNQTILNFYETITTANGTSVVSDWYNVSKAQISIPLFFTTTNVSLILETFWNTSWTIYENATAIEFWKAAFNYTEESLMYIRYVFDPVSGWLTWLSQVQYSHNGTLLSAIELTAVNFTPPETTTTVTVPPTTSIPPTTEPIPTSESTVSLETTTGTTTSSNSLDESTTNSSTSQGTTSAPPLELTPGWGYAISIVGVGIIIFKRKRLREF